MNRFDFSTGAYVAIVPKYNGADNHIVVGVPKHYGEDIPKDLRLDMTYAGYDGHTVLNEVGSYYFTNIPYGDKGEAQEAVTELLRYLKDYKPFPEMEVALAKEKLNQLPGGQSFTEFNRDLTSELGPMLESRYGLQLGTQICNSLMWVKDADTAAARIYDATEGKGNYKGHNLPGLIEDPNIVSYLSALRNYELEARKASVASPEEQFKAANLKAIETLRDALLAQNLNERAVNRLYNDLRYCTNFSGANGVLDVMAGLAASDITYAGITQSSPATAYKEQMRNFKAATAQDIVR